jgi:peptidoglycan/xylan/chitin deacetylase (PgdA/CDA1 family)
LAAALIAASGLPFAAELARAQDTPAAAAHDAPQAAANPAPTSTPACPGNPNALGTSRVVQVPFEQYPRVGRMQYPQSLPLADKEVVLTFDDGPLPPYSNQILDILKAECVKVTYFMVGTMARAYPAVVRRAYEEGHTIGTHSDNHPTHIGALPSDRMQHEIDGGIADVSAALGDAKYLAPFFRIPGLDRSAVLESELADRDLVVFSSDTVADDWHHAITPNQIISLAVSRLKARGKGILLLHDIHPKTVAALPGLLRALKDNGFHIVQAVPSAAYLTAMAAKPKARMLASAAAQQLAVGEPTGAVEPAWPQAPAESTADLTLGDVVLPAPDASDFEPESGVADSGSDVRWPDQPAKIAVETEREEQGKVGETREASARHESARMAHSRRHAHQRAQAQSTDVVSRIKAFATLFSPTEAAH